MRAPDTHVLYPIHPDESWQAADDPADLGTAFGLDASLAGPEFDPWPEQKVGDSAPEAPMDWLGRRSAKPGR